MPPFQACHPERSEGPVHFTACAIAQVHGRDAAE
jgi:hypothetical protein